MKTKRDQPLMKKLLSCPCEGSVQREIEDFFQALNSYPDQFARDPQISFEQHMFSVAMQHLAPASEVRRRPSTSHT